MKNNKTGIITFIISFLVVGSLSAIFLFSGYFKTEAQPQKQPAIQPPPQQSAVETPKMSQADMELPKDQSTNLPSESLDKMRLSSDATMAAIIDALEHSSDEKWNALTTSEIINIENVQKLRQIINDEDISIAADTPVRSIGTWDSGNRARYVVQFSNNSSAIVDMVKDTKGKWSVYSIVTLSRDHQDSSDTQAMSDALGVAEQFMQFAMQGKFNDLAALVNHDSVAGVTLAGLCILFEDGQYHLRGNMPFKGMFATDNNAGFLVYLDDASGKPAGNVGLTLERPAAQQAWLITDVALDSILQGIANTKSDGSDIYIPIVKNPKGGDSLSLLFGFNEDTLTPRSREQLRIVAQVIKASQSKQVNISGHTDDVGGEKYNFDLSKRRAESVKRALIEEGVSPENISTKGLGKTQPIRMYKKDASERELQEARRLNRRAEMYLDF